MGLVAVSSVAPMAISTVVGGTLTDRMSHRWLAIFAGILSGLSVAAIPALCLTGGINLPVVMALVVLGAIFDGPDLSTRQAMIPKLTDRAGISRERVNSGLGFGRSLMKLA